MIKKIGCILPFLLLALAPVCRAETLKMPFSTTTQQPKISENPLRFIDSVELGRRNLTTLYRCDSSQGIIAAIADQLLTVVSQSSLHRAIPEWKDVVDVIDTKRCVFAAYKGPGLITGSPEELRLTYRFYTSSAPERCLVKHDCNGNETGPVLSLDVIHSRFPPKTHAMHFYKVSESFMLCLDHTGPYKPKKAFCGR